MPLRAYIDGKEVVASFLDDQDWHKLKSDISQGNLEVIIAQTGKPGYLRVSKRRVKHFVHKRGQKPDNWKPESPQHLLAKAIILKACKEAGWDANSEHIEGNWIADTIACSGDKRIAFEVQWSKQTYNETARRQQSYKESNVRGCWFFKSPPREIESYYNGLLHAEKELPVFKIYENEKGEMMVKYTDDQVFKLAMFTKMLLQGKFKFVEHCRTSPKQMIEVGIYETHCYHCGVAQYKYFVVGELETICKGNRLHIMETLWADEKELRFHPDMIHQIKEICRENKYELASIKKRYGKTVNSEYWSFGCNKCDALFGDFYGIGEKLEADYENRVERHHVNLELESLTQDGAHWCLNRGNGFCG